MKHTIIMVNRTCHVVCGQAYRKYSEYSVFEGTVFADDDGSKRARGNGRNGALGAGKREIVVPECSAVVIVWYFSLDKVRLVYILVY